MYLNILRTYLKIFRFETYVVNYNRITKKGTVTNTNVGISSNDNHSPFIYLLTVLFSLDSYLRYNVYVHANYKKSREKFQGMYCYIL